MKTRYIIALASGVLTLAGCQKNELQDASSTDSILRFAPSVVFTEDADGGQNPVTTKGTLINNNDNPDRQDIPFDTDECFYVKAWTVGASTADFDYTKVLYRSAGDYWITVGPTDRDKEYLWKSGQDKTFHAYANMPSYATPVSSLVSSSPVQTLTVTDLPASSADQKDILLGYYTNGSTAKTDGLVPLKFYHPMTAVLFKKGSFEGTDVTVSGISIEGVYTSGTATMDATSMAQTDNADKFVWSGRTGSATISLSDVTVDEDDFIGDAFILIPQTFASDSEARITVSLSDGSVLYTPLAGLQWKAGYTNVYTINLDRNVIDLTVYENFNGTTKSNVCVRNTGTANSYVRAAVVANWVTAEGLAVQACDLSSLAFNTTDWAKSGDFYYCKKAIRPGSRTPNLFDTFSSPSPKPDESLHVEMTIIAQGVELDYDASSTYPAKAETAWGITDILENAIME